MATMRVSTKELLEGDVVAEDVFVDHTSISLIIKDTVVNERIKNKLSKLDIGEILINRASAEKEVENLESPHNIKKMNFKNQYREKVCQIEDMFLSVFNGEEVDSEEFSKVAENVFKDSEEIYIAIESISEMKAFDDYTYIHSVNVALYSMLLAQWLELEKKDIKDLVKAALLHDIGKGRVDRGILNKPGSLTSDEFKEMKNHPQHGVDICNNMKNISDRVKEAVLSHHEKIDGSGYPHGKKDEEISLFAKIISICDTYDAITSDKVYKGKLTPFESFDEMIETGYGKFDTQLMLTFLNNIGNLYVGLNVETNTGEIGEIVFIPPKRLSQPVIKIGDNFIDLSVNHEYKIEKII